MPKSAFSRLQSTVIDGRLANVFYRRQQLHSLHEKIIQNKTEILDAISNDSGHSAQEALAELYSTLNTVKQYHDSLNPEKELEDEYRIAKGKDAPTAAEGVGIVYIQPTTHTLFNSVMVPLAAAIAAGNCALLVIEQTLRKTSGIIQRLLQVALDPDIIEIVRTKVQDAEFLSTSVQVVQSADVNNLSVKVLQSPLEALVVGIVDRTANIEEAAKSLVDARFTFSGNSSYAPDVVLVNEFVKRAFLNAVVRHSIKYLTAENGASSQKQRDRRDEKNEDPRDGINIVTSGSNGSILDVEKRTALSHLQKVKRKALHVHSVRSLEDAFTVIENLSDGNGDKSLLATYAFATPDFCKYITQFTNAHFVFANHIPLDLLIGPAAPFRHGVTPSLRYPLELFQKPKPNYINKTPQALEVEQILSTENTKVLKQLEPGLLRRTELEKNRPVRNIIGFFEQGILLGLATVGTPVLVGIGALGYYGVTMGILPRLRR